MDKYITKMKKHPLARAFRVDKFTLAALNATLFEYYDEKRAVIYKENVMKYVMVKYQNLDNYEVITDYLKSLPPKQFYKKLKEYFESYNDFQPHYDLALTQAQFNKFGTEIGVKINTKIEPA